MFPFSNMSTLLLCFSHSAEQIGALYTPVRAPRSLGHLGHGVLLKLLPTPQPFNLPFTPTSFKINLMVVAGGEGGGSPEIQDAPNFSLHTLGFGKMKM